MILNVIHNAAKELDGVFSYLYTGINSTSMWTSENPDDMIGTAVKIRRYCDDHSGRLSINHRVSRAREFEIDLNESGDTLIVRHYEILNGVSIILMPHITYHQFADPDFKVSDFLAGLKELLYK